MHKILIPLSQKRMKAQENEVTCQKSCRYKRGGRGSKNMSTVSRSAVNPLNCTAFGNR